MSERFARLLIVAAAGACRLPKCSRRSCHRRYTGEAVVAEPAIRHRVSHRMGRSVDSHVRHSDRHRQSGGRRRQAADAGLVARTLRAVLLRPQRHAVLRDERHARRFVGIARTARSGASTPRARRTSPCATESMPTRCPARSACSIPRTRIGTGRRRSCTSWTTNPIRFVYTSPRRPAGISSMATRAPRTSPTIVFENYDRLADTPTEVSPSLMLDTLRIDDRIYRAMVHHNGPVTADGTASLSRRAWKDRALREHGVRSAAARDVHVPIQHRIWRRRRNGAPLFHAVHQRNAVARGRRAACRGSPPPPMSISTCGT